MRRAISAWLMVWSAGCVTTGPALQATASRVDIPTSVSGPDSGSRPARARNSDADPASKESESLRFARRVLESKAAGKLDAGQREAIARLLAEAEREHGIPVALVLAMIEIESRFDPHAKGPSGAIGLMQLRPATARAIARRVGVDWQDDRTLLEPEQNTRLGLAYLTELRARLETADQAIAAYNIGPSRLRRLLAKRPLTHGPYLRKIHAHADALRQAFGEHAKKGGEGERADPRQ